MTGLMCAADGCMRPVLAKGLCSMHYARVRRGGGAFVPFEDRPDWPRCVVEGCIRPVRRWSGTYCNAHAERLRKHGSTDVLYPSGRKPGGPPKNYLDAHNRLRRILGRAGDQPCVDCGEQAREWSLSHDAVEVRVGPTSSARPELMTWSDDPQDYEPRCRSCHVIYDRRASRR